MTSSFSLLPFALVLPVALVGARVAQGAPITVHSNLESGSSVDTMLWGLHAGSFDVSVDLEGQQIVTASVSFTFGDDGDPFRFLGESIEGSHAADVNGITHTSLYEDDQEFVEVRTAGETVRVASTMSTAEVERSRSLPTPHCTDIFSCHLDVHIFVEQYDRWGGTFGLGYTLNPLDLADLSDGIFPFTLLASGTSVLIGSTLTMELQPIRREDGAEVGAVPEPATLSLVGLGLAALVARHGFWRRNRRPRSDPYRCPMRRAVMSRGRVIS